MGIEVQKGALPTLLNFAGVRAASEPHVLGRRFNQLCHSTDFFDNPLKYLFFLQILRNHVMVRVGGGWDTLQHYLDKHDPCRCKAGK